MTTTASPPPRSTPMANNIALQSTNPNLANYQTYNPEHKKTDMDYLRLQGKVWQHHY